uniref:(northern house mosquito) hypothetical protein n=1 Tax=Culex pipiens TaxID=7175 RepID=A0A8D8JP58_CULPI
MGRPAEQDLPEQQGPAGALPPVRLHQRHVDLLQSNGPVRDRLHRRLTKTIPDGAGHRPGPSARPPTSPLAHHGQLWQPRGARSDAERGLRRSGRRPQNDQKAQRTGQRTGADPPQVQDDAGAGDALRKPPGPDRGRQLSAHFAAAGRGWWSKRRSRGREFGGNGRRGSCRVRAVAGTVPPEPSAAQLRQRAVLSVLTITTGVMLSSFFLVFIF